MTDRKIMHQALCALTESKPIDPQDNAAFVRSTKAIEALIKALAQPEPFKPDWVSYRQGVADGAAQPEQEPVAWMDKNGVPSTYKSELYNIPLQKLVECNHKRYSYDVTDNEATCRECGLQGRMVFVVNDTAPPRKEWVGLTDDEINKSWEWAQKSSPYGVTRIETFAKSIETKLKERNSAT